MSRAKRQGNDISSSKRNRPKMKTSYFAKPRIRENPDAVSIALYAPKWWGKDRRFPLLAPTPEMLRQGYSQVDYFRLLDERIRNPHDIYEQLKEKILCCYEKTGKPCHQRYTAKWFESRLPGVKIPEME